MCSDSYKDKQIWELKYISTSDEEDNDSSDEDDESDEEEDKDKEPDEPAKADPDEKIWKEDSKNSNVPDIAKKLKPSKKKQRIYFTYTQEKESSGEPKKNVVVRV